MSENEEEYDDELPPIAVNRSHDSSEFVMPRAGELASQRAREEQCERELRALRETRGREGAAPGVAALAHSDSSGSEGEAALAAAVGTLRVQPALSDAPPGLALPALLEALSARLPPQRAALLTDYLHMLHRTSGVMLRKVTDDMVCGVVSALAGGGGGGGEEAWSEADVVCVGAWLCALACAGGGQRVRRALHQLLDLRAAPAQVWSLAQLVSAGAAAAAECGGGGGGGGGAASRALLEASDAARSGAGGGADLLAALLVRRALVRLLQPDNEMQEARAALSVRELGALVAAGWRRVPLAARYVCVQLAGRALAGAGACAGGEGEGEGERARVLAALAHPLAHHRHQPDHLKVAVGASKLQLLFRARPDRAPAPACHTNMA